MRDQRAIFERVRENEELAAKFHQVEVQLLSTLDYRSFFDALLHQIADTFAVPRVWCVLLRDSEVYELMKRGGHLGRLQQQLVLLERATYVELLGFDAAPGLFNEDLGRLRALCPAGQTAGLGSLAVVPLTMENTLTGALVQADSDPLRYRPGLNTIFLQRLAVKLALGLSNVTAHEKLKFLAYHDPLTQLLNRRVMEAILDRELSRAQRYGGSLSLAFIDLDDFKQINDTHGHDVGDQLLKYVAEGMAQMVRASDVVTRYAGDEFVILLPETGLGNARRLVARMQESFYQRPLQLPQLDVPVRLSAGLASTEAPTDDAADLLRRADQDLYRTKKVRKQGRYALNERNCS